MRAYSHILSLPVGFLLVLLFANSFSLWQWLSMTMGAGANLLPFGVSLLLGGLIWYSSKPLDKTNLFLALALLGIGFLITDPQFPAKRIHLAQYCFLCAVQIWILGKDKAGLALGLTILLGIHDEFIQGILDTRTFGWRDMVVNATGALAGAILLAGTQVFKSVLSTTYFHILFGLALTVGSLAAYPSLVTELWVWLPLVTGLLVHHLSSNKEGLSSTTCLLFLTYPVLIHVFSLSFK